MACLINIAENQNTALLAAQSALKETQASFCYVIIKHITWNAMFT